MNNKDHTCVRVLNSCAFGSHTYCITSTWVVGTYIRMYVPYKTPLKALYPVVVCAASSIQLHRLMRIMQFLQYEAGRVGDTLGKEAADNTVTQ